jgi:hypothetical protein
MKKPRLVRGSLIQVGGNFSNGLFLQIYQVQIFLHLSALITVPERFFWLMFQFAERVAGITDDLDDGFHHFFHNAFFILVTELCSGSSLPCCWPDSQLPYSSVYETRLRVCHSKFSKIFLKRNQGKSGNANGREFKRAKIRAKLTLS